jgi:hypothetical protein
MRCAGRSEKPPGPFTRADVADDLDALLRSLNLATPVDVIGRCAGFARRSAVGAPSSVPINIRSLNRGVGGQRSLVDPTVDGEVAPEPAVRATVIDRLKPNPKRSSWTNSSA